MLKRLYSEKKMEYNPVLPHKLEFYDEVALRAFTEAAQLGESGIGDFLEFLNKIIDKLEKPVVEEAKS